MEFTFTWNITHIHRLQKQLYSPTFMVEAFERTEWRILMEPTMNTYGSLYKVTLCKADCFAGFGHQQQPFFIDNSAITLNLTSITHNITPKFSYDTCNGFYSTNPPINNLSYSFSLGYTQSNCAASPSCSVKLVFSLKKGTGKSVNVGQCRATTRFNAWNTSSTEGDYSHEITVADHCGKDGVTCNQPASSTLKQDMLSMYRESLLSDKELKTKTKSFPVHACILSARSPVFNAMFTSDMKESREKSVLLPDMDEATVSSMLNFIYQDSVDELQWDSCIKLYCAANQYQIPSLKLMCSDFLTSHISVANACEALSLADMCQDEDFKIKVQKFIKTHKKEILKSDSWMKLEEENSILSLETLRQILLDD